MKAKFGTAGNSRRYLENVSRSSLPAPAWLSSIGLDAYEYQCGRGVHIGRAAAEDLGRAAQEHGITLSLHAPYFINLTNTSDEGYGKNRRYILDSCRAAASMGAERAVVHCGGLMGLSRRQALENARESLARLLTETEEAGFGRIFFCIETMGKTNQLGDLTEVLELCYLSERLIPCVDFGHLYARSLGLFGAEETIRVLADMERALGKERAAGFHCHFSKVEYSPRGGEKRHLNFSDPGWGPDFEPLAAGIAERGYTPTVICESAGEQSEDAAAMKELYRRRVENRESF
ncbi:TIM barrel protein [Papillibacter cinnamivorans]|uniref:Deoxyribonuclease-4 n=1 Tax=Papillibacter cinnamivorans DSM 12816 TaxID=1122930 RepID=A0A1W1ZDQ4_9FIRM|nr:TIM barrel protein [Papillibacter cinnamivorans]SMC46524.1 deoxyribonuclease-4 [Papillibacter cinnamivorans DSM 12816]